MAYNYDALYHGYKWRSWASSDLKYYFLKSNDDGRYLYTQSNPPVWDINEFNDAQKTMARTAMDLASQICNVKFREVGSYSDSLISWANGENGDSRAAAFAYSPMAENSSGNNFLDPITGDIFMENHALDSSGLRTPIKGEYGYQTFIHELGHALGLKHSFEGSTQYTGEENSWKYTVMAYYNTSNMSQKPVSFQLYDIATLQQMYGANMSYATGNDTYNYDFLHYTRTIWDAAGVDTLDTSASSLNAKIDLHAGAFSSIGTDYYGGMNVDNLAIAYGATIENATTGAGNDTIIGNDVANVINSGGGNDTVDGAEGNDTMDGGAGMDTLSYASSLFAVKAGSGYNVVYTQTSAVDANGATVVVVKSTDVVNDFEVVIGSKFDDTLDGYQELDGGYGNDKITGTYYADMLTGGYGNDTMNGFQNNDVLMGGDGDDVINGGDGDDRMDGGDGFDTLNGENGTDILAFGASWGAINLNISTGKATSMSGVVFTDTFTGFEIYQGSGGADSITGSSVNDTILGSLGSDTLSAGAGTDKLSYRDINFGVVVDTSGVVSFAGFTQSISGFEIYAGTNYNDKITGSALAETIDGGEGRDTLDGGAGVDMLSYDSAVAGMVIDISNNMAYYSPTSPFTNLVSIADMFTNFEAYTGTIYADTIRGSTASESIFGGNGNDIVDGGDGNDSISGGFGGDTLVGGAGNDTIDGGSASDTLDGGAGIDTYIAAGYRVNVNAVTGLSIAYASPTLTTVDSTDTISNFESYIGAYGNDTIVGSYLSETIDGGNGNDVISGGDGNDTIYCSAGNDTLDGGNGVDLLVSNVGLSVNLNTGTASLWNGLGLPFSNTKLATLTISNFESFKGGDYNDTLIGAAANDTFEGAAGSDSISGGAGNDFIDGSVGNDTLDGGIGIDTLSYDTLKYLPNRALVMDVTANSFATWLVDNSNKQASLQNLDTVSNFEVYVGTVMGDTMKGGVASETIDGALGGDLLDGRAGDDVLIGGAGNDIFVFAANAGKDHIKDFDDGYTTAETMVMYDMIDLGGRADVTGFADVMARAVQVGTDTVITFTGGDVLTLDGVDKLSLTTFDFTNY